MSKGQWRWPYVIAIPAAVAIWSGWVGLGGMCGFGLVQPFPGIVPWHLNTAITLPIGVEAYGAFGLSAWLRPGSSERARLFAKRSAIGALVLGAAGQVAFHWLTAIHVTRAPWPVVVLVSCMPVVVVGFAATLAHLLAEGVDEPVAEVAEPLAEDVAEPETPLADEPEVPEVSAELTAEEVLAKWPPDELAGLARTLSERRLAEVVGTNRNQAIKVKRLLAAANGNSKE